MPNYNHGRYLRAALQAHLDQSQPPVEIIVVDDGSTDDSLSLVQEVAAAHPRVRPIALPVNGGVNAAMNRGLREACGDFVCFCAADDLVTKEFAARSVEVLARFPEAAFCFSDLAVMRGDSGAMEPYPFFLSDAPCMLGPADLTWLLKRHFFIFPSNTMVYRKERLLALGGFRAELAWLADWFANYVLAFRHGACYVPEVLGSFRRSEDSYSARGTRDPLAQRARFFLVLDLLASETFRDVARPFRTCGVVPELRMRMLVWLLSSPGHRRYLTPRLAARLLLRPLRAIMSPYVPARLRRAARRLAGAPARRRLAAG
jgi:glycosyltransferase involved in cell wall biosynthesis